MRLLICLILSALTCSTVSAQVSNEGFDYVIPSATQGNERSRQRTLWILEVHLKPMRLTWVDVPDPKTGEVRPELFYYLCYRAVNRPIEIPDVGEAIPMNRADPEPGPPYFIPEFTLIPQDTDTPEAIMDSIVPEVLEAINQKERRTYPNSVSIMKPVPDATEANPDNDNALYGVAIFRGVDPDIDRFTIYMNGFSNGYQTNPGPDGKQMMSRKTIMQKFWRPGDKFDPESLEIRFDGEAQWMYRPDAFTINSDDFPVAAPAAKPKMNNKNPKAMPAKPENPQPEKAKPSNRPSPENQPKNPLIEFFKGLSPN